MTQALADLAAAEDSDDDDDDDDDENGNDGDGDGDETEHKTELPHPDAATSLAAAAAVEVPVPDFSSMSADEQLWYEIANERERERVCVRERGKHTFNNLSIVCVRCHARMST